MSYEDLLKKTKKQTGVVLESAEPMSAVELRKLLLELLGRKLNKEETVLAIRFAIVAEYEAIDIYTQIAEASDDPLVKRVMTHVIDEERVHAGEFLRLLQEYAPDEAAKYAEGTKEVEDEMKGEEATKV